MSDVAEAAVALTAELVAIDSVNPGLVPGAAGEAGDRAAPARLVSTGGLRHARGRGRGDGRRPSLVAVGPGSADGSDRGPQRAPRHRRCGRDAGAVRARSGTATGSAARGAADMKGGVAALVAAAEAPGGFAGPGPRRSWRWSPTRRTPAWAARRSIAALPDPGHPAGRLPHRRAHRPRARPVAARVRRGPGAVPRAGRRTARSPSSASTRSRSSAGSSRPSTPGPRPCGPVAATSWSPSPAAATRPFVVPESAECLVERRTVPGRVRADRAGRGRALLPPEPTPPPSSHAYREAWELDAEGPAADLATRLGGALGDGATFDAPYWMEAPLWQAVCPTLVCGPSGGGLHAADEWVDLRQVRAFAEALPGVLREWADARRAD